jgi:glycosyltransferase involved in cell wall biosynthesis
MQLTISIIVPVYNVEKYLDKCVKSLLNQTYNNIEVILIDDGSTDSCYVMCDDYAKNDQRVKVIHKPNGGLSDARNTGMLEAIGEYLLFVDSDDYIDLDSCERFINVLADNSPDILAANAKKINNQKVFIMQHYSKTAGEMVNGKQYLKDELKHGTMYMAACLNLYRRTFLLNNELKFKVGLLHEDELFTPQAFLQAANVIGTDIVFYNYLIREGSITNTKNKIKNASHLLQTCNELENLYNLIEDDELRILLNDNLVNIFLNTYQVTGIHQKKYSHMFDKNFLKGKAYTKRNKCKVALFLFNERSYYLINKLIKFFKMSAL